VVLINLGVVLMRIIKKYSNKKIKLNTNLFLHVYYSHQNNTKIYQNHHYHSFFSYWSPPPPTPPYPPSPPTPVPFYSPHLSFFLIFSSSPKSNRQHPQSPAHRPNNSSFTPYAQLNHPEAYYTIFLTKFENLILKISGGFS
jgi:hypothetical protein